ncbi:hypothetical protein CPB86DRAFT_878408 [Serendipita vermifera]|nr:hypothetical protein CPB86DRAFT_878408 [Serendipita vermifera]
MPDNIRPRRSFKAELGDQRVSEGERRPLSIRAKRYLLKLHLPFLPSCNKNVWTLAERLQYLRWNFVRHYTRPSDLSFGSRLDYLHLEVEQSSGLDDESTDFPPASTGQMRPRPDAPPRGLSVPRDDIPYTESSRMVRRFAPNSFQIPEDIRQLPAPSRGRRFAEALSTQLSRRIKAGTKPLAHRYCSFSTASTSSFGSSEESIHNRRPQIDAEEGLIGYLDDLEELLPDFATTHAENQFKMDSPPEGPHIKITTNFLPGVATHRAP